VTNRIRVEKENQSLLQRILQSEKLETIGALAGGVSHYFNNQLAPLIGYAELLAAEFEAGDRRLAYTDQIIQSGLRAKRLTEQLLTFSLHQLTRNKTYGKPDGRYRLDPSQIVPRNRHCTFTSSRQRYPVAPR
jgi:signal transduction histidine kinase